MWPALAKTVGIDPALGQVAASCPPIVVGDVVIVGSSHIHGYYPTRLRNLPGWIRGFDIKTGRQSRKKIKPHWRFQAGVYSTIAELPVDFHTCAASPATAKATITTAVAHTSLTTGLTRCSQLDPRSAAIDGPSALTAARLVASRRELGHELRDRERGGSAGTGRQG